MTEQTNKEYYNKIKAEERMKTIEIFFDMYPELKKNKDEILMNVLEKYGKTIKYILTRYDYNNNIYYIDSSGMIVDKYLNFKGIKYENEFYFNDFNDFNYKYVDIDYYDKLMNYKYTNKK
jgi:hypothetical protein